MTTELAPDAQFEELVERVLATTIFNEPFVTQLITEAHNARGRVAEAEAERDTARQIASNAIAEAKKLRAELAETDSDTVVLGLRAQLTEARQAAGAEHGRAAAFEAAHREVRTGRDARDAEIERLHTWDGLMSLLDEHWPETILPTLPDEAARDAGSRIVSLIRWVEMLHTEQKQLRARHGSAPLTLAQAAGHLHDWARDLDDGTRTDWPAGHPDIIHGIRAAADWLDARATYETETPEPAEMPDAAVDAVVKILDQFLTGHLDDRDREGEDWSGPHPISIESDARRIIAAAREAGLIGDTDA